MPLEGWVLAHGRRTPWSVRTGVFNLHSDAPILIAFAANRRRLRLSCHSSSLLVDLGSYRWDPFLKAQGRPC